jgi:hypothetical protein
VAGAGAASRLDAIQVDGPVLAFAIAIAAAATLAASLGPAIRSTQQQVALALGATTRLAGAPRDDCARPGGGRAGRLGRAPGRVRRAGAQLRQLLRTEIGAGPTA